MTATALTIGSKISHKNYDGRWSVATVKRIRKHGAILRVYAIDETGYGFTLVCEGGELPACAKAV